MGKKHKCLNFSTQEFLKQDFSIISFERNIFLLFLSKCIFKVNYQEHKPSLFNPKYFQFTSKEVITEYKLL